MPSGGPQGQVLNERRLLISSLAVPVLGSTCNCVFCQSAQARRKIVAVETSRTKTKLAVQCGERKREEEGEKENSKAKSHLTCLCCSSLIAKPVQQTAWNKRAKQPMNHGAGGPCRGELVLLRTRLLPLHLCGLQGQALCRPSQ